MYLGSVKFYKHLIYTAIALILVLAVVGLCFLISLVIPNTKADADTNTSGMAVENKQVSENDTDAKTFENQASSEKLDKSDESSGKEDVLSDKEEDLTVSESEKDKSYSDNATSEPPAVFESYPNLYCEKSDIKEADTKTAYITFDDGPSDNTEEILEILKEYDIKATFFVNTGDYKKDSLNLIKTISDAGHTVGIHSHSHIYKEIYDSKETFLEELNKSFNIIYEKTGIKPSVIRFPGGSINSYNSDIYYDITEEVLKRNFRYYDWNVSFEDAKNDISKDEIYQNALNGIEKNDGNNLIILSHDRSGNNSTLEALKMVIEVLKSYGYSFDKLDNSVDPITFSYK